MILKTFDPKKADAIFAEEGETPSWLAELIDFPTWRSLIYRSVGNKSINQVSFCYMNKSIKQ